jgi:hypothetical protein
LRKNAVTTVPPRLGVTPARSGGQQYSRPVPT